MASDGVKGGRIEKEVLQVKVCLLHSLLWFAACCMYLVSI